MKWLIKPGLLVQVVLLMMLTEALAEPVVSETRAKLAFDARMFKSMGISAHLLEQFNVNRDIPDGNYRLDVFLNDKPMFRKDMELRSDTKGNQWVCIDKDFLQALGIRPRADEGESCNDIIALFPDASAEVDGKKLQFRISMPQIHLISTPRGHVEAADLDAGITALTVDYLGTYQLVHTEGPHSNSLSSGFLSLNAGMNFGQWQLRQHSALQYLTGQEFKYQNQRSYIQRPILNWGSELIVGQTFTPGRHFPSLSFTGVSLRSDERMLPDSMRGFAPVVRGVAQTNAKVTVKQNGYQIYQTTVAPGSFEIRDLYPTSLSGDLEVEVTENDGRLRLFTVPFSAVPESLRPGISRYEISIGRTRDTGAETYFADAVYSQGLNNLLTGTAGLRVAQNYLSSMVGSVVNSNLGAIGAEFTYMTTDINASTSRSGWMAHLSYSRMFRSTSTVVTLAGYRYSTNGYRELSDVIGVRSAGASHWNSSTYRQRDRFNISVNQPLGQWGSAYLSASTGKYRNRREDDKQIQLGFSKSFSSGVNVNLAFARQRKGTVSSYWQPGTQITQPFHTNSKENTTLLSVSIPLELFSGVNRNHITIATSRSSNGNQLQAAYSGTAANDNSLSYGLSASHTEQGTSANAVSANASKRFSKASVGVSASRGKEYWQAGASVQGAAVVHADGVTLGSYLGNTAALVEAPGAEGARVWGSVSGEIDSNGFALVPSIQPYRYNHITLDPQGMTGEIDLLSSEQRTAPYAGALVKLKYETRAGYAMLIHAILREGARIPMGADVTDENGETIAMVGQGNQIYLRTEQPKGRLIVQWGKGERCLLEYSINDPSKSQSAGITMLKQTCH